MFSNNKKYNPDVNKQHSNLIKNRNKSKFKLLNNPYRIIIENKKEVKNSEDLLIDTKESNQDIQKKFEDIANDRKIKPISKKNIPKIDFQQELNDQKLSSTFDDLKSDFKSEYEMEQKTIKLQRKKFNNIIDSLLEDGILD
jgi:hypothetical protein